MDPRFTYLFAGVGGILVLASIIGWILAQRVTSEGGRETVRNLNERVRAWWVMVIVFASASRAISIRYSLSPFVRSGSVSAA